MATTITPISFAPSLLLSYYSAQMAQSTTDAVAAAGSQSSTGTTTSSQGATGASSSGTTPPWNSTTKQTQQAEDASVLALTNFIGSNSAQLTANSANDSKLAQDNQKLFTLYQAVSNLSYLASMSQRSGMTAGQLAGYNTRFQQGLQQVESYIGSTSFNNFKLQAAQPSPNETSTATVPLPTFGYTGGSVVTDANIDNPLNNVSTDESFNIAVTHNGTTSNVAIDLSQISGPLTIDNVVNYVNQQLAAAGVSSRFQRTITQGSINDPKTASYGIAVNVSPSESVTLSSSDSSPAIYLAGNVGNPTPGISTSTSASGTSTSTTPSDQQGRLVKLSDLSSSPTAVFSDTNHPSSGTTTATATAVDSSGNVYTIGNATGNIGGQINQAGQDVVLSKYDSAGNLIWQRLLGASSSSSGYSLAVNPNGGVVVSGSTTGQLAQTAVSNGNNDSFVASYDQNGNQNWVTQIPTLSNNQANTVTVDSSGNVYIGGQVTGVIGSGQTSSGGSDAYVAKLDSSGSIDWEQQFGTSSSDSVAGTAMTSDGGLVVASVQNGQAMVSKYANGNATSTPEWTEDLGSLNGGSLAGITVSGNQVYVAGSTSNTNLTANGAATVANASAGGTSAFVFSLTDNGTSATPDDVSYVGTGANDTAGGVTVGPDGTVYLTGTTTGTFAGQTRSQTGVPNQFVAAIGTNGAVDWTRQYGGADGQSTGQSIAIDPTGSSVLDALGLPQGEIQNNSTVDLASNTTVRAGDSFNIQIAGPSTRTATITIQQGETLDSLATQINAELINAGKASVVYSNGAQALKIAINKGFSATLQPGASGFDALSRLGLGAVTLSNAPTKSSSTTSSSNSAQVFGLGLTGTMDISTTSSAGAAKAELGNVMAIIQNIYSQTNTPASSTSITPAMTGTVSAATQAQLSNYNLALSLLSPGSSTTSTSSSAASLMSALPTVGATA
jgi:hypothetical protein